MDGARTQDDGLLGSLLVGLPDDGGPGAEPRRRGRTALLVLLGVVAGAVLAVGGWTGTTWLRDHDLRGALALGTGAVVGVAEDVAAAQDLPALVVAVQGAPLALQEVERARARAVRAGRRGGAVLDELAAQRAVLDALAPLAGLGSGPLQAWGRGRGPLQEALERETRTRAALGAADRERLAALDGLAPTLDRLGGPLLRRAADGEVQRLAGVLASARTTADLRAAAELAAAQRPAVQRSLPAVPLAARPAVDRVLQVLTALGGLTTVSGQDPTSWDAARDDLVGPLGQAAVQRADDLVRTAVDATAGWQEQVAAAQAARAADVEAVDRHARAVRGLAARYRSVDARLDALLAALVGRPLAPPDLPALAADVGDRRTVLVALAAVPAPAALAAEHARVVGAATGEADAVQALADALGTAAPTPVLADLLRARAAAEQGRRDALAAWDAAAVRTAALVAKRPLPELPEL